MILNLTIPLRLAAPDDEEEGRTRVPDDGPDRTDVPEVDDVDVPTEDVDDDNDEDGEEEERREDRRRTVGGTVLEYGVRSHPGGPFAAVTFAAGSLATEADLSRVKLLRDHDSRQPIGVLADLDSDDARADATFRLGRHQAASDALVLAEDGVLDGFSVGVEPLEWSEDDDGRGVTITSARLHEVSMVALPAYSNARATRVSAIEGTLMNVRQSQAAPERAPAAAAPLTAALPMSAMQSAPTIPRVSQERYVDAQGYTRSLPGIVVGRERIDACDYLAASLDLLVHGNSDAFDRVRRVLAAAVPETTDLVPGLLPQIIIGPIIDRIAPRRPVWLGLSERAMPSLSNKFERLRITGHTAVDKQAKEMDEVASGQLKVQMDDVAKSTYGGWVNLSRQVQDWSSPGALGMIIEDLAANVILKSEIRASADLVATATSKIETATLTGKDLNAAIYAAAAKVFMSNPWDRVAPDRIFMDPEMWALVGGQCDDNGRPLFPVLNPMNALGALRPADVADGGTFAGLRVIVGPYLPATTLIVGASRAVEVYEDQRGMIQVPAPSVLGTQVAAYAYLATYQAHPLEMVSIVAKAGAK